MRWLLSLILLFWMGFPPISSAQAPTTPIAKAELLVDAPLVKRGKPIMAVVAFTLPEGWHIYWKNPGDAGLQPLLQWTLPEGLQAGDISWPTPMRFEAQGVVNYGYSGFVALPVALTPSHDAVVGEVGVQAKWLVCKDICIPESAELSALLMPNAQAATSIAKALEHVPSSFRGSAIYRAQADAVTLTITRDNPWGSIKDIEFFPADDGVMKNGPALATKTVGNDLIFSFPRGSGEARADWHGVLSYREGDTRIAWDIAAKNELRSAASPGDAAPATPTMPTEKVQASEVAQAPAAPLFPALLLAFLGGLLLNIMPCVLPILALKALAVVKKADISRKAAAIQGISYAAGVVLSFLAIAGVMLAIKATGTTIGWGFQLQNPWFVGFLALIMLLVGLNLLGKFELPVLFGTRASTLDDSSPRGSFFTGALAVLVATPCTAPFMATAVGATLAMPAAQALLVFAALGIGMASPFLVISLWPAARKLLPKPGAWMVRFKQILAVPMLATMVWLLWVLTQLLAPTPLTKLANHEDFSPTRLEQLRTEGKPVFVDVTATWCITCKINERVALKPEATQALFRAHGITLMVADWTTNNPEITEYLARFNRNGVPLYVYYPPRGEPRILPQILTPALVREAVTQP